MASVKKLLMSVLPTVDIALYPFIYVSAWLLRQLRRAGVHRLPRCKNALLRIGVFPIRNHYYEPQFDYRQTTQSLSQTSSLSGIDWNVDEQLQLLGLFSYTKELEVLSEEEADSLEYHIDNPSFASGDAEYFYQLLRLVKPK